MDNDNPSNANHVFHIEQDVRLLTHEELEYHSGWLGKLQYAKSHFLMDFHDELAPEIAKQLRFELGILEGVLTRLFVESGRREALVASSKFNLFDHLSHHTTPYHTTPYDAAEAAVDAEIIARLNAAIASVDAEYPELSPELPQYPDADLDRLHSHRGREQTKNGVSMFFLIPLAASAAFAGLALSYSLASLGAVAIFLFCVGCLFLTMEIGGLVRFMQSWKEKNQSRQHEQFRKDLNARYVKRESV